MQRSANTHNLKNKSITLPGDQCDEIQAHAVKINTHGRPNFSIGLEAIVKLGLEALQKLKK